MRAILSEAIGGPRTLVLKEIPDPEPLSGTVVIDIQAAALNFPDLLIIEDKYQVKPPRPFIPGGEVAGIVSAVGEGVTDYKIGDRVIAAVVIGGFAEKVLAPVERCYRMPDRMPFDVAASLFFTYGTSYHALERAKLRRGERMLVLGAAGGVGVAAMQLGKARGAEIVAAARGAEKLEFCRAQGADITIDYAAEDLKTRLKQIGGVDVVYDAVGGDWSEPALRGLRPEGRFLVVGFAAGTIPKIPLNLVLLKEADVIGIQWGAWTFREPETQQKHVRELFELWEKGSIAPQVDGRWPLSGVPDALVALAERRVRGKAVILPQG